MNYQGSTCICRVPKSQVRTGTVVECVHCGIHHEILVLPLITQLISRLSRLQFGLVMYTRAPSTFVEAHPFSVQFQL